MPNKIELHAKIDQLTKERNDAQAKSDWLFKEDITVPNKTELHEQIEQLIAERDSWKSLLSSANVRIAELKEARNETQAKANKLFEENESTPCISVHLIRLILEEMLELLPDNPNRYDLHKWASTIAQEIMIDQAKDTRIEVDTIFIEPADLRVEYPTGTHEYYEGESINHKVIKGDHDA